MLPMCKNVLCFSRGVRRDRHVPIDEFGSAGELTSGRGLEEGAEGPFHTKTSTESKGN